MELHINEINKNTPKLDFSIEHTSTCSHYAQYTGVFPCGVCGKSFSTDERLNIHLYFHTSDKSFNCKICRKGFTKMSELISHTKDHRNEKPIKRRTMSRRGTKRRRVAMQYM